MNAASVIGPRMNEPPSRREMWEHVRKSRAKVLMVAVLGDRALDARLVVLEAWAARLAFDASASTEPTITANAAARAAADLDDEPDEPATKKECKR